MSHSQQGSSVDRSRERESRHLWVGGLPDNIDEAGIKEYFSRFGKIEGVKILPQKYPNIGVAAFIDFYDVKSATEAKETKHTLNGQELRTNFKSNPGEKYDGSKPQDKEKQESDSSSSGSESGSSSSSSSSDSDHETSSTKKGKKKSGGSTNSNGALLIKVTGLANRPERVLLDGLYYEFGRYSTNVVIKMYGDAEKRWAVIKYRRADKCREAFTQSQGVVLFGSKIKLSLIDTDGGHDSGHMIHPGGGRDPISRHMQEDLDPQATRSLFVGNIPKQINVYELRDAFLRYGNVLDVEIKKMGGTATYGFILYYDLMSAVTAKQFMDGHNLKGNNIRVGFGKGTPSKQVWIDGLDPTTAESQLERHLSKYGKIVRLGIDHQRCCAMVQYDDMEAAKEALLSVKGIRIKNSRKLMTDFANRDARSAFFSRVMSGDGAMPPHRGFPGPPGGMFGSDMMGDPHMMMPHPGMHMMGRGGAFPPHGHPMDYYYNPYMDEYYGRGRPPFGPPGMRRFPPGPGGPYGREGPDEYDEELRAFSRKREREKRNRRQDASSESGDSQSEDREKGDEEESRKRKKATKGREKGKKVSKKAKDKDPSDEGETDSNSSSEDQHEELRLKATRKSKDLREKLKKKSQKKVKDVISSDEENSEEEVTSKSNKSKNRYERKSIDKDYSPAEQPSKKKTPVSSVHSSPQNSPLRNVRSKQKQEKGESEEDYDFEQQKPQAKESKEYQRKKEKIGEGHRDESKREEPPLYSSTRVKGSRKETSNGTIARSARDEEKSISYGGQKKLTGRVSEDSDIRASEVKSKEKVLTPESPAVSIKSSHSPPANIESDLSSGEDFKEKEVVPPKRGKSGFQKRERSDGSDNGIEKRHLSSPMYSPRHPRTPDLPLDEPGWKGDPPRIHPHSDEEEDNHSNRAMDVPRKSRKQLPRRYQIDPSSEQKRDSGRYREGKESRPERRYHVQPSSPTPPPSYSTHPRKKHFRSPPPMESFDRRRHRGRPYSPGGHQHRRYSRSPPYPASPPLHRIKSPYGSPPHRSPIPRPRGPRHRYESPPFEGQRSKYLRGRGVSPPSPHHRYPFSPSPPPPRNNARSPAGRRHGRHRSSSLSPPRLGRGNKRDRSPGSDHLRASPRPPDYEVVKRYMKEEYPDSKRRRIESARPKSPTTPPPSRDVVKASTSKTSRQAHPPHPSGTTSEKHGYKSSNPSSVPFEMSSKSSSQALSKSQPSPAPPQENNLMDLLRRYPVMWQGHLMLKNDAAAVQLHFLSGNVQLANSSLPQQTEQKTPVLRISQRMRLEKTQLDGVDRRIQAEGEHCLLLALPCGRDANDVHSQTHALKTNLINYLLQKKAAGIINIQGGQGSGYVLHIFPPCPFSQSHLSRVAPDLLSSASDDCHLMIIVATM